MTGARPATSPSSAQPRATHGTRALVAALERAVAFGRFRAARRALDPRLRQRACPARPARRGADRRAAARAHPPAVRLRDRRARRDADPTAARRRPRGRAAPAAPVRHPKARPRAAGHRQDPTLETRGVPAHPGRGRDRLPRRVEHRGPPEGRGVPGRPRPSRSSTSPPPRSSRQTFDYLASLEWIRAKENLCLVGPAGTGKSHLLVALGHAAVEAGHRVRYFTAADLVETLYRGLADNSVGRVIDRCSAPTSS